MDMPHTDPLLQTTAQGFQPQQISLSLSSSHHSVSISWITGTTPPRNLYQSSCHFSCFFPSFLPVTLLLLYQLTNACSFCHTNHTHSLPPHLFLHSIINKTLFSGEFQIGDNVEPLDPNSVASVVRYGRFRRSMSHRATGYSLVYSQLYPFEGLQNYTSGIIHHVRLTGTTVSASFASKFLLTHMHLWVELMK